MLVYSWVVIGVVVGVAGHLFLRDRGYDWFGEILVGIAGASVLGAYGPVVLGIRTGSVDILSDVASCAAWWARARRGDAGDPHPRQSRAPAPSAEEARTV